jgi:hypothetical protein
MNLLGKALCACAFFERIRKFISPVIWNSVLLSFSAGDEHDAAPISRVLTLNRPAWSASDY